MKDLKRQTVIFRTLSNINRLKIIDILSDGRKINVTDIASALKISINATSNQLSLLKNLDVLEAQGTQGHVFYSLNKQMPADFKKILDILI